MPWSLRKVCVIHSSQLNESIEYEYRMFLVNLNSHWFFIFSFLHNELSCFERWARWCPPLTAYFIQATEFPYRKCLVTYANLSQWFSNLAHLLCLHFMEHFCVNLTFRIYVQIIIKYIQKHIFTITNTCVFSWTHPKAILARASSKNKNGDK
jgi:hypothetical protein